MLAQMFLGLLACVILDTAFGLILIRRHAPAVSGKMALFCQHGMIPVVQPHDPFLDCLWHQVGSALQIGLSLGVLSGLLAAGSALFQETLRRDPRPFSFWLDFLSFPLILLFLFSEEVPFVSLFCALLTPWVFRIPWRRMRRHGEHKRRKPVRVACLTAATVLSMYVLLGGSPHQIRDNLSNFSLGRKIVHFYYDHTPLAAHVIQPLPHLTQKVIAQSQDLPVPEILPHGTLWIVASNPCMIRDTSVVIGRTAATGCFTLPVALDLFKDGNALLAAISRKVDPNRAIRRGVRASILWGFPTTGFLLALWGATILEDFWLTRRSSRYIVLAGTLCLTAFTLWSLAEREGVKRDPSQAQSYAASNRTQKRYLALKTFPDRLSFSDLTRLASDPSFQVRHAAFVEMARRGDPRFHNTLENGLNDREPLVRAKAALALAKAVPSHALGGLKEILAEDPSWYVRDNAYRAIRHIRPVYKVVWLTHGP